MVRQKGRLWNDSREEMVLNGVQVETEDIYNRNLRTRGE